MSNQFTCADCGETFDKGRSDEEALKESKEIWGEIPQEDMEIICEDCYQKMMKGLRQ